MMKETVFMTGLIAAVFTLTANAEPKQPNVVFILVDDMGWTGLSTTMDQGVKESGSDFYLTPNVDRLANEGMVFSRAYSPGPMCTPSRAGILTGKNPAELHMTTPGGGRAQNYQKLVSPDIVKDLPMGETSIAETLKQQGYATAHFGKWHLGQGNPGQHGFDSHDGSTGNDGADECDNTNPKDVFGVTDRAMKFMEEQSAAGKPFYLQLSHYAVHAPVKSLASSNTKFAEISAGKRHSNVEYAAMTHDFDTSVGYLLKKIHDLKLEDHTYIILMSDNGAPGNRRRPENAPLSFGKGTLYEGGIRVPLIIQGPGIKSGTRCSRIVTGCDLFPTICDWAGEKVGEIEGSSLTPLLLNKPSGFKRRNEGLVFHYPHYGMGPLQKPQSAFLIGKYKLLRDLESGVDQLFDLESDISETSDLAKKMPEISKHLSSMLDQRLKQLGAQSPSVNPDFDPRSIKSRPP
jgi:arylsulfatase A-like enzyme